MAKGRDVVRDTLGQETLARIEARGYVLVSRVTAAYARRCIHVASAEWGDTDEDVAALAELDRVLGGSA